MEEIWKEVYGFDVLYEVSNKGRVRTKYDKHIGYKSNYTELKPLDNGHGYLRFNWRQGNKQKTVYVHQLVAQAFVDNPNGYTEVNHKDENKKNNNASNLEWCSHQYNASYGTKIERGIKNRRKKKIHCITTGQIYESVKEAASAHSVCNTAITNCINGLSKTSCGLEWEYVDA